MSPPPLEIQLAAVALAASLAVGLPVRIAGARATVSAIRLAAGLAQRRKFTILGLGTLGAAGGLWSLESVRQIAGGLLV